MRVDHGLLGCQHAVLRSRLPTYFMNVGKNLVAQDQSGPIKVASQEFTNLIAPKPVV
jgi:hypothetical protein